MNFLENLFQHPEKRVVSKPKEEKEKEIEQEKLEDLEQNPELEPLDPYTLSFRKEHVDVPELAGFDPEWELAEIKKIYNRAVEENREGERAVLMDNFKKKLAEFRKNMSYAQQELETFLRSNPDASQQEMLSRVDVILEKNQVQSQERYFCEAVNKFRKARRAIKEVTSQYQEQFLDNWQKELFNKLFSRLPYGTVDVDIMPMNLYFHIDNVEDYALALGGDVKNILSSGGAVVTSPLPIKQLDGKILIENSSVMGKEYSATVRVHEEEHAIHGLYPPWAMISYERGGILSLDKIDWSMEDLRGGLKRTALQYLNNWEKYAKSEILAYLKTDTAPKAIKFTLLTEGGLYDYFQISSADFFVNFVSDHFKRGQGIITIKKEDGAKMSEEELQSEAETAIKNAWEQYKENIDKAIKVVEDLLEKYGEAKRPAVLRLLSQEPLNKWHRLNKLLP